MKMIIPLALCLTVINPTLATGDECRRTPDGILRASEGEFHNGILDFKYESRAQRYSPYAMKFTWCIENVASSRLAKFNWGTDAEPTKYYDATVEPGHMIPRIGTDSSELLADGRVLNFRRVTESGWNKLYPETIHFRRLGSLRFAQNETKQTDTIGVNTLVDLEKLSEDRNAFNAFVKQQGKIELYNSTIITVPARAKVQTAIEARQYEKYDPNDFTHLELTLYNRIRSVPDAANPTISTITVELGPASKSDEGRFFNAIKEIPFELKVTPMAPSKPGVDLLYSATPLRPYFWQAGRDAVARDGPLFVKELLQRPAIGLTTVDVVLSLTSEGSPSSFGTLPAAILVPTNRSQYPVR